MEYIFLQNLKRQCLYLLLLSFLADVHLLKVGTKLIKHHVMKMFQGVEYTSIQQKPPGGGLESASKLYRPSDRRLSANLVPTFADTGWNVASVTDPYSHILGFSRPEPLLFLPSSSSIVLTRLSGPRSRPTIPW
jgi:hypothetical protein